MCTAVVPYNEDCTCTVLLRILVQEVFRGLDPYCLYIAFSAVPSGIAELQAHKVKAPGAVVNDGPSFRSILDLYMFACMLWLEPLLLLPSSSIDLR